MASVLLITPAQGVVVVGSTGMSGLPQGLQPLYQAMDISSIDMMDVELGITGVTGGPTGVTIDLFTSMQKDSDDGSWLALNAAAALYPTATPSPPQYVKVAYSAGLLRYLRWKCTFTGSTASVGFWINAMGRRLA